MKFSTNIPKYFKYVKILKDKVNLKVPNNLKNYELTTEKVNILVTRTLSGVGIGAVPIENIKSSTNTSDTVINSGPTNQPFEFEPEVVKSVAKKNLQPLTESSGISGVWISQKYSANISDTVINSGPINQSFEFEQEIVQSVAKETLQPLTESSGISGVCISQKYSANTSDTVINSGTINQSFDFEPEVVKSVAKETLQPLTESSGISGVWISQKYSANTSDTVINSGPINQSFEFEQEIVQSVARETLQPLTESAGISGVWILQKCGEYLHLDFSLFSCNFIVLRFGILIYKGTKSLYKLYCTRRDTKKIIQGKLNTKLRLP